MNSLNLNSPLHWLGYGDFPRSSSSLESGSIIHDYSVASSTTQGTSECFDRTKNFECESERVALKVEPSTRIRRPRNSFFQFLEHFTEVHQQDYVFRSTLVKDAATVWKSLPPDDKKIYIRRAEQEDVKHKETYPDYKYRPSKPENHRTKLETSTKICHSAMTDSVKDSVQDSVNDSQKNGSSRKRTNTESLSSLSEFGKVRKTKPAPQNIAITELPVTSKERETKVEVTSKGLTCRKNNTTHIQRRFRQSQTQRCSRNRYGRLRRAKINEKLQHLKELLGLRKGTCMADVLDTCINKISENNDEQRSISLSEANDLLNQLDLGQQEQQWWYQSI